VRRDMKILLGTACLGAVAVWGHVVPETLVGLEIFRVKEVDVRGLHYMTKDAVVDLLDLTSETSVWGDKTVWADRVLANPVFKDVRITRRVPNGLLVVVTERTPIALAPTPTLEPVDAEGYRLPLDPAEYRLDLPVIESKRRPPRGSRLFPTEVRRLAAEVDHLMASDTSFLQLISSVESTGHGEVLARWTDPPVDFLLPSDASPARLREALSALRDAVAKSPNRVPDAIDLRFADQVVVRWTKN
jgi:POTRA domain, FtsQ-type